MSDVAIVGAGELGGSLAHVLARRDVVASIELLDEHGGAAVGKALDIAQAAPIEGFATQMSGGADLTHAAGARIVVIADRFDGGEWSADEGLMLLKRFSSLTPRGPVTICAGAESRTLVERGVRELKRPRGTLIGTAPEALAAALRAVVALESGGGPGEVSITVLGVPPAHVVIPWDDAAVGGFALSAVLDEPARRRLAARVPALWPPGPYALAWAAAQAIEAVCGKNLRTRSCFVGPDDSQGVRARASAVPVRLDPRGITEIAMPPLSARERVALDNATEL